MTAEERLALWKEEERAAVMTGWDFSHIAGKYEEDSDFPWDYRAEVLRHLSPEKKLLDIDTGGGEMLLSLEHPFSHTAATEAWAPNVALCREKLLPLGIDFKEADGNGTLPFSAESFDIVTCRHGDYCPQEIFRVLKPGGVFITQQVGAENERELVKLLLPDETELPFPKQYKEIAARQFAEAGFVITAAEECRRPIRFFDVGALVWFAKIIAWEFPNFSVDRCREALLRAQDILLADGALEGRTHRFFLLAQKP